MKKTLFEKIEPYLYLLPAFVLLVLFVYLPFVNNTYLSFNRVNQFREIRTFAGLSNYSKVLTDPVFWQSVGNTFVYCFSYRTLVDYYRLYFSLFSS